MTQCGSLSDRIGIVVGRILVGVGVLAFWEWSPELLSVSDFWFSRPSVVGATALELLNNGTLLLDIAITLAEMLVGLALGCGLGIPLGIVLGRSRFLQELFEPFLLVLNALPKIALAPLFLIWFGVGFSMKVAIAFSLVVIVMILNTYLGMRTMREELVRFARTTGANERQIMAKIVLPSIMPWLFSGLKVSVGFALIGAILGEFIASQRGIGYLIDNAVGTFETPVVFVGLLVLLILSMIINAGVDYLRRRLSHDPVASDMRLT